MRSALVRSQIAKSDRHGFVGSVVTAAANRDRVVAGRLLDYDYCVVTDDPELSSELATVMVDSATEPEEPELVEVITVGADQFNVRLDGAVVAQLVPRVLVIPTVTWNLNRRCIARMVAGAESDGSFLVHAGAVELEGRGVLLVGESGVGKSTASVGLGRLGFGYLSDDVVLLEPSGTVRGSKKPVGLRRGGITALDLEPVLDRVDPPGREYVDSVAVPVSSLGVPIADSAELALIVFVVDGPDVGRVVSLPRSIALQRIVENCFDTSTFTSERLAVLAGVVRGTAAVEWSRGTVGDLAATLRGLLGQP